MTSLAAMPAAAAAASAASMCGVISAAGDLGLGRDRVGDELAAGEAEAGAHAVGAGDGGGVVEAEGGGEAAVAGPEGRERVLAVGDDRDAAGLQHFEGLRQVEDGLGAGWRRR